MKRYVIYTVLFLFVSLKLISQERPKQFLDEPFRGISVHLDAFSPIMGRLVAEKLFTGEAQVDVNLYNKLFPTLEFGYGFISNSAANGSTYEAQAPFFRLGANFNLMKVQDKEGKNRDQRNYPFLGVRYGMSLVNYSLKDVPIINHYWDEYELRSYNKPLGYVGWLELVGGIRVDLYQGLTMGWSVRLKLGIHGSDKTQIWYVPGYGVSSGANFAFNYTIGYTFRTAKEKTRIKGLIE